jgi:hypothetical protein
MPTLSKCDDDTPSEGAPSVHAFLRPASYPTAAR